ncbi:MAG TPA: hypothetical protein V6D15_11490 [Oculatellaceae cyanobacterium]
MKLGNSLIKIVSKKYNVCSNSSRFVSTWTKAIAHHIRRHIVNTSNLGGLFIPSYH